MWYRIELAKDGAVRSCVEVEGSFADKGKVYYIEAESKADAIKIAAVRYKIYRQRYNAYEKKYTRALISAGKCKDCRESLDTPRSKECCLICLERRNYRQNSVRRGEIPLTKRRIKTDEECAQEYLRQSARAALYNKNVQSPLRKFDFIAFKFVLAQYRSLSPADFEAWLVSSIETAERERARLRAELACNT